MEEQTNNMTDLEFEIMDQLYFVISYDDIVKESNLESSIVRPVLWAMIQRGWVKCLRNPELEIPVDEAQFKANYRNYHYLATKKGLFVHNAK